MRNILYLLVLFTLATCSDNKMDDNMENLPVDPTTDNSDFEILMQKIRTDFSKNPNIAGYLKIFDDTKGAFTDINYSNQDQTNWEPAKHTNRLSDFVFAYTNPTNPYFQNENIYNKIIKGLEFWYNCNPKSTNWWNNQIDEPQKTGILLIQMRTGKKQVPAELETKILQRIRKEGGVPSERTGANRTDIALHWIYRSCLERNVEDLNIALQNVFETLTYTTDEGIQHDNSYFQHGQQLYIGGYGDEILKGVTQVAMYTNGSQYALSQEKKQILSTFMRHTYYRTIRGQYMLFDVLGRGVSRPDATQKSQTALFAKRMLEIDPEHTDEYEAIIARLNGYQPANYKIQPVHTHYFRGDYTLHIRPDYTFDVRTVSNRTSRCEYGNRENLKTYFMSDGCTNIVIRGDEYANIFPCWNWARIPGVTSPQMPVIPLAPVEWQNNGTSTFAGGVSDGLHGVSTYSYTDNYYGINTSAKKSWFFFDQEVVCLGAGISSGSSFPIQTTVNQCLHPEGMTIQLCSNGQQRTITEKGENEYNSPDWILHNGIGYAFPKGGSIYASNQTVEGSWNNINHTCSANRIEQDIFALGFNHGVTPENATYAYIVVPNIKSISEMKTYHEKQDIEILANTSTMQIVRNKQSNIWQMIFYRQGTFQHTNITVKVDKACALMFKDIQDRNARFYIADPSQAQSRIQVNVQLPQLLKEEKSISCEFTGTYAGASKEYSLQEP